MSTRPKPEFRKSTKKAGVAGWPVLHSLSPRLFGYWFRKYNIDGDYQAYPVEAENLAKFIEKMRDDSYFCGINLTIPHKETVIRLLDEVDNIAKAIGAVNCVVVRDRKLCGTNTDAYGFIENIKPYLSGNGKAVVFGAGGAAKAIIFALQQLGFKEIVITNRTKDRAEILLSDVRHHLSVADWEKRGEILEGADLLVNTTSLGMKGKEPLEINLSALPKNALVTDVVYNPLITSLLVQAQMNGNVIVDGLGMLLHQAVPAFELWFGKKPEITDDLKKYMLSGN